MQCALTDMSYTNSEKTDSHAHIGILIGLFSSIYYLSQDTAFPTRLHVPKAKTAQADLSLCCRRETLWILDCADMQAELKKN